MSDVPETPEPELTTTIDPFGERFAQPVTPPKKKFFTPLNILFGVVTLVAIAALAWGTTAQIDVINDNKKIESQRSTIASLNSEKDSLNAEIDSLNIKLATETDQAAQCLAQSNSLTQELSAVQTQLTNWSNDPLGYTLDPTLITQYRDAAAADTCTGSIDPNVPSS